MKPDEPPSKIEVIDASERADDKFFYGPDVGEAVQRGAFLYTKYGEVIPCGSPLRMLSCDRVEENYADWSEERRRAVRAAYAAEARRRAVKEAEHGVQRDVLVERARAKLTAEEFNAVYEKGIERGRGR